MVMYNYNTYLSSHGSVSCLTITFLTALPASFTSGFIPTLSAAVVLFVNKVSSGLAPCWRSHSTTSNLADAEAKVSGVALQRHIKTCHTNTIIIFHIQKLNVEF